MKDETTILVVCERPNDGPPIDRLLTNDFSSVVVSIDPRRHLSDFELYKPAVLVLALTTIAKAERFLQHLERPGTLAGALPFRVIALASRDDAAHAFELCQQGRFDAYVNQGSEADDPMQLRLAVRGAARSIASERAGAPTPSQFALHARRAVTVGSTLDERLADCTQALDAIESAVAQARGDMTSALDKLGRALASAPQETRTELAYLRDIAIASQFQLIGATVQAAHERMGGLKGDISTLHDTLRSMRALGEAVRPRILVIDDDKFQHRLLQQSLRTLPVETAFATSAAEGSCSCTGVAPIWFSWTSVFPTSTACSPGSFVQLRIANGARSAHATCGMCRPGARAGRASARRRRGARSERVVVAQLRREHRGGRVCQTTGRRKRRIAVIPTDVCAGATSPDRGRRGACRVTATPVGKPS